MKLVFLGNQTKKTATKLFVTVRSKFQIYVCVYSVKNKY